MEVHVMPILPPVLVLTMLDTQVHDESGGHGLENRLRIIRGASRNTLALQHRQNLLAVASNFLQSPR